ncbi:hypothetical protein [Kitasatospora sp. GP82]|uniref:hypothetical protein n=1 Tax=Kitasatospora sp. GP82 TaxID=3035089 RepID=UPI002473CCCE|nr:hypothetical protein [Kitasatospora sp. GP82]MDH6129587.1 hypothetical protein [Kitasatospora sp. GP82]
MSNQGAPPQHRPDDGWWHTVYAGPAGTLPDTPDATAAEGSIDDWFETAAGMIGAQRGGDGGLGPALPSDGLAEDDGEGADEGAGADVRLDPAEITVDDWFDSAAGMIGGRRTIEHPPTPEPTPVPPLPPDAAAPDAIAPGAARPDLAKHAADPEPPAAAQPPAAQDAPDLTAAPAAPAPKTDVTSAAMPLADLAPTVADDEAPLRQPSPRQTHQHPHPHEQPHPVPHVGERPPTYGPEPTILPAADPHEQPHPVPHVGERPPTYGPEPTILPAADPDELAVLVPDTVIEGAQYGAATVRAASVRGDSARYRGEPRRDSLLLARFGEGEEGLLLAVLATPGRSKPPSAAAAAAAEACRQLAAAIGRSRPELAADLRAGARDRLRYGLQRLTARAVAPLRSDESSIPPNRKPTDLTEPSAETSTATGSGSLHCLLLSLDPDATHRAAFGTGLGGLYLLRSGHWIDAYGARLLHHPDGRQPVPPPSVAPPRPFRFRLVPATPGDILLLCSPGLAEPIAEEAAVAHFLSSHWAHPHPPGTVDFLRQVQVRAKGYTDDRTAVALWTE